MYSNVYVCTLHILLPSLKHCFVTPPGSMFILVSISTKHLVPLVPLNNSKSIKSNDCLNNISALSTSLEVSYFEQVYLLIMTIKWGTPAHEVTAENIAKRPNLQLPVITNLTYK